MSVQADKTLKVRINEIYTPSEGEGLLSVSDKVGIPLKSIKVANDLVGEQIPSGTKLIIPLK